MRTNVSELFIKADSFELQLQVRIRNKMQDLFLGVLGSKNSYLDKKNQNDHHDISTMLLRTPTLLPLLPLLLLPMLPLLPMLLLPLQKKCQTSF